MSQVGDKIITKKAFDIDFENMTEMSAEEVDKELEKKLVNMKDVTDVFNDVIGQVLTIVDASVFEKQQNKAVKDLIKRTIYDGLDNLHALTDDQA